MGLANPGKEDGMSILLVIYMRHKKCACPLFVLAVLAFLAFCAYFFELMTRFLLACLSS